MPNFKAITVNLDLDLTPNPSPCGEGNISANMKWKSVI